jgi:hypothetical protein
VFVIKVGEILILRWNNTEQLVSMDKIENEFYSDSDSKSTNTSTGEMIGMVGSERGDSEQINYTPDPEVYPLLHSLSID